MPQILHAVSFRYVKQCPVVFALKFALFSRYCVCNKPLSFSNLCAFFAYIISRERKATQRKKTSEQCFSGEMKPTCQNSASFKHFQKWPKNLGDVLAYGLSIVLDKPFTLQKENLSQNKDMVKINVLEIKKVCIQQLSNAFEHYIMKKTR